MHCEVHEGHSGNHGSVREHYVQNTRMPTMFFSPSDFPCWTCWTLGGVMSCLSLCNGRPGEDGEVQRHLESVGLSYNGSGADSFKVTINKIRKQTKFYNANGFSIANMLCSDIADWNLDKNTKNILQRFVSLQNLLMMDAAAQSKRSAMKKNSFSLILIFRQQERTYCRWCADSSSENEFRISKKATISDWRIQSRKRIKSPAVCSKKRWTKLWKSEALEVMSSQNSLCTHRYAKNPDERKRISDEGMQLKKPRSFSISKVTHVLMHLYRIFSDSEKLKRIFHRAQIRSSEHEFWPHCRAF